MSNPKGIITDLKDPTITVDNLQRARFIYLRLNNVKVRQVFNTILALNETPGAKAEAVKRLLTWLAIKS